jgi:hypothetical protein
MEIKSTISGFPEDHAARYLPITLNIKIMALSGSAG